MGNTEVVRGNRLGKMEFVFEFAMGKGGFGKVWVVEFRGDGKAYAMKEMLKLRIVSKNSVNAVLNERRLLSILRHPFLVNMKFAFQDRDNLYLAMDLMTGGDLRYHLNRQLTFSESQTKFFAACILTGLEYIHINSIIHRDIKPENLVLDSKGYIRITDFGIAQIISPENSKDSSGTPGYMAPEVLNRKTHDQSVDYFALGILIYEFMTGKRPYLGRDRREIKEKIISKQARLVKSQVPPGWSMEAVDFVNKLIERNPDQRLGARGPQEVKSHIWLRDFNWKALLEKKIDSPFKPKEDYNYDPRVFLYPKDDLDHSIDINTVQGMFAEYYFDYRDTVITSNESTLKVQAK